MAGRSLAIGIAVILGSGAAGLGALASQWPFSRDALTRSLERALHARVSFKEYTETLFPPGCTAKAVTITSWGQPAKQIATFQKLTIEASYAGLFARHVRRIVLDGASAILPLDAGGSDPTGRGAGSGNGPEVVIDEIIADRSVVQAGSLRFDFRRLTIQTPGANRRVGFDLDVMIPKPPGELTMAGHFGPWRSGALDEAELSGSYRYQNADLGVFDHLGGTLSSKGKFRGMLSRLEVVGSADVPDFEANRNGHRHHLKTVFQAFVNGMNGDTLLPSLRAELDRTTIVGNAAVRQQGKETGKTIDLDVTSGRGRIEDLLLLFMKSPRAPMQGPIDFRVRAAVPPGRRRFTRKVRLEGDFDIRGGDFTNPKTQAGADSLSEHAEGEPADRPERVSERLRGRVSLRNGVATFINSEFVVPGAQALFDGTYDLVSERVNLRGKMAMQAKLSQATTGVKSFLLKFLDPFYKKQRAGAVVPVSLTGTYDHPQFQALMAKKRK